MGEKKGKKKKNNLQPIAKCIIHKISIETVEFVLSFPLGKSLQQGAMLWEPKSSHSRKAGTVEAYLVTSTQVLGLPEEPEVLLHRNKWHSQGRRG